MYDDSICILFFTVLLRLSLATRLWPPIPSQPSLLQPFPGSSRSLILPSTLRSRISQTCEIPANGSNPRRWGDTTFGTWRLYRGKSAWRRVPARRIPQPTNANPNSSTDQYVHTHSELLPVVVKDKDVEGSCRWPQKSRYGTQRR